MHRHTGRVRRGTRGRSASGSRPGCRRTPARRIGVGRDRGPLVPGSASMRLAGVGTAPANCAAPAARLSWSALPVLTPESSGATRPSKTSSPSRLRTIEPTDSSPRRPRGSTPARPRPLRAIEVARPRVPPLRADDPGGAEDVQIGRHAEHEARRQPVQRASRPHQRRRSAGDVNVADNPSSSHSSMAPGTRARNASAPRRPGARRTAW